MRPTQHSALSTQHSNARKAFSLIELMIAIMILGLGMVMVATVFPVGLDMARDAVQTELVAAAADAAAATIKIKVPIQGRIGSQTATPPGNAIVVRPIAFPYALDPTLPLQPGGPTNPVAVGIENDVNLTPPELVIASGALWHFDFAQNQWFLWDQINSVYNPLVPQAADLLRISLFTQESLWSGDMPAPGTAWPVAQATAQTVAYVIDPQNVPVDYLARSQMTQVTDPPVLITERPAFHVAADSGGARYTARTTPRLSIAEQVYPPLNVAVETIGYLLDPDTKRGAELTIAKQVAERRYSWTAIYTRAAVESEPSHTLIVATTSRADLGGQFAAQKDQRSKLYQSMNGGELTFPYGSIPGSPAPPTSAPDPDNVRLTLVRPTVYTRNEIDTVDLSRDRHWQDALFPRPWLVLLSTFDFKTGEIRCTAEVARLLPVDSYLILAATPQGGTNAGTIAGRSYKIVSSAWNRAMLGLPENQQISQGLATLQVAPGTLGLRTDVLVWVFPPPIATPAVARDNVESLTVSYDFGSKSPVVGIAVRGQ